MGRKRVGATGPLQHDSYPAHLLSLPSTEGLLLGCALPAIPPAWRHGRGPPTLESDRAPVPPGELADSTIVRQTGGRSHGPLTAICS